MFHRNDNIICTGSGKSDSAGPIFTGIGSDDQVELVFNDVINLNPIDIGNCARGIGEVFAYQFDDKVLVAGGLYLNLDFGGRNDWLRALDKRNQKYISLSRSVESEAGAT